MEEQKQNRARTKRVPLELTPEEYRQVQVWARSKGFEQVAPALRWGLRQLGAISITPDGTVGERVPQGGEEL